MFSKKKMNRLIKSAFDFVVNALVVIALAWFCVYGFADKTKIFGQSMQPLIYSGETVWIDKISYELVKPARYDVIFFHLNDGRENIKRIIGLPGETVQIKDGLVYVNDSVISNRFANANLSGLATQSVFLGANEYFVLGDNRDSSEDSRFESVGNVNKEDIVGKVWLRVSPITRIGLVK